MSPSSSLSPIRWSGWTNPAPIRSPAPEYQMGPVAPSPPDTADFQSSVLHKRDIDPQLPLARWLKGLQRAIYDWAHAASRSGPSASGTTASGHPPRSEPLPRRPPSRLSRRAVCSPQWGVLRRRPIACCETPWRWGMPSNEA